MLWRNITLRSLDRAAGRCDSGGSLVLNHDDSGLLRYSMTRDSSFGNVCASV